MNISTSNIILGNRIKTGIGIKATRFIIIIIINMITKHNRNNNANADDNKNSNNYKISSKLRYE